MREPYVFPMSESPFSTDIPPLERRNRVLAVGADVVTDEIGAVVDFMSEVDVEGVLNDTRFAAVALPTLHLSGVTDGPLWDLWTNLMFAKDNEDHKRIRSVMTKEFSPRRIERLRPAIESIAGDLVAGLSRTEAFDLVTDFAIPFSSRMVCAMLGVPQEDAPRTATWGFDLARAFFPFMSPERKARAEQSAVEITAYMDALLAQRRADPKDDVISMLASADTAAVLSPDEVRALACNMVFAGLEATAKGVATGAYLLMAHGKLAALAAQPEVVETAVLEMLRFFPPAQNVARLAPVDMVCQDVALKGGQVVSANVFAACRDPKRYSNPDELDLQRPSGKQLPFGAGPHYCLGASLGKLGLGIALLALASGLPDLRLAEGESGVSWDYEGFAGVMRLLVLAA